MLFEELNQIQNNSATMILIEDKQSSQSSSESRPMINNQPTQELTPNIMVNQDIVMVQDISIEDKYMAQVNHLTQELTENCAIKKATPATAEVTCTKQIYTDGKHCPAKLKDNEVIQSSQEVDEINSQGTVIYVHERSHSNLSVEGHNIIKVTSKYRSRSISKCDDHSRKRSNTSKISKMMSPIKTEQKPLPLAK